MPAANVASVGAELMPGVAQEKAALIDTLRHSDPDASTLCEGWNVRRLLAHLVQREQDLVGGVGDAVARQPPGQETHLGRLAVGARSSEGYQELITRFDAGPPAWSPMSWAAETINLVEYVVHHEDVRRGGAVPAEPRVLPSDQESAIWRKVPLFGRFAYRSSPVGVTLARSDGQTTMVKKGAPEVILNGTAVELALYVSGRRDAARVHLTGSEDAVAQFETWVATT